jgi:hypothetical protein
MISSAGMIYYAKNLGQSNNFTKPEPPLVELEPHNFPCWSLEPQKIDIFFNLAYKPSQEKWGKQEPEPHYFASRSRNRIQSRIKMMQLHNIHKQLFQNISVRVSRTKCMFSRGLNSTKNVNEKIKINVAEPEPWPE